MSPPMLIEKKENYESGHLSQGAYTLQGTVKNQIAQWLTPVILTTWKTGSQSAQANSL
jgi:hypothetical protein